MGTVRQLGVNTSLKVKQRVYDDFAIWYDLGDVTRLHEAYRLLVQEDSKNSFGTDKKHNVQVVLSTAYRVSPNASVHYKNYAMQFFITLQKMVDSGEVDPEVLYFSSAEVARKVDDIQRAERIEKREQVLEELIPEGVEKSLKKTLIVGGIVAVVAGGIYLYTLDTIRG